jgi:hypothetical protein
LQRETGDFTRRANPSRRAKILPWQEIEERCEIKKDFEPLEVF